MPGVPNTARCLGCKRRKVKCDLRWPTCSTCERANMVCSGPTLTTKFIHAGSQGRSTDHRASESVTSATGCRGAQMGSTYSVETGETPMQAERQRILDLLRMESGPRKYPSTVADRITIRLINTIERDPIGDILFNGGFLKILPQRLGVNSALRDCVALFCYCWTNYRCPERINGPVFHELHGKALRSLMRALQNPTTQLSTETCAAVTLMGRCNLLFDSGDPTLHQKGIAKMMRTKGPPRDGDDLHLQLTIANSGHIFRHWAATHCTEDIQWLNSWQDVLGWKSSSKHSKIPEHVNKRWQDQLNTITGQWPGVIMCMKEINNPYTNADRRQGLAERTHDLVLSFLSETETTYRLCVLTYEAGMKMESSLGEKYPSHPKMDSLPPSHEELLKPLTAYMPLRIIFSRAAYDLSCILGAADADMYEKYHRTCQQAWDLLPHLTKIDHPIANLNYVPAVFLCFEIVEDQASRDYYVNALKSTNIRRILPSGRQDTERWLTNICRLSTGRDTTEYDFHVT